MERVVVTTTLLLLLSVPALANTSPEQRANDLYNEGKTLMQAGELEQAEAKFTEAWGIFRHPLIMKKRAEVREKLREYQGAVADYKANLKAMGSRKKNERRIIRDRIASLKALLTKPVLVTITSAQTGVNVSVDGGPPSATPFEMRLVPGSHSVVVRDKRYMATNKQVNVLPGPAQVIKVLVVPRTGRLIVSTDRENFKSTQLSVDAVKIELRPTERAGTQTAPREVVIGEHALVCIEPGIQSYYTMFEVKEDEDTVVHCDFASISAGMFKDTWGWVTAGAGIVSTAAGAGLVISYFQDAETAKANDQKLISTKHIVGGILIGVGVALGVASYFVFTRHVANESRSQPAPFRGFAVLPQDGGAFMSYTTRF